MSKKIISLLVMTFLLYFGNVGVSAAKEVAQNKKSVLEIESLSEEETQALKQEYKSVTKDLKIIAALEAMKESVGNFSRLAIMGNNLSLKPIKIEFKDLAQIGEAYREFDALGWKRKERLYIYINQKHFDAPPIALASLLAHEALHQDEFNSINEETYAWTLEAAVWTQLSEDYPKQAQSTHPLVVREEMLKKLFVKGNYTDKYIRKTVMSNPGYSNLPSRSRGFEDSL